MTLNVRSVITEGVGFGALARARFGWIAISDAVAPGPDDPALVVENDILTALATVELRKRVSLEFPPLEAELRLKTAAVKSDVGRSVTYDQPIDEDDD